MRYIITEQQLEKLQQMARNRHLNREPETTKGELNYNGENIKYLITKRDNKYVSVRVKYDGNNYLIYIMPDEDFITLSKEEKENIIKYKVKNYLNNKLTSKD
jgi:hypothetical protein